jgi:glutathionylspermidine synthase
MTGSFSATPVLADPAPRNKENRPGLWSEVAIDRADFSVLRRRAVIDGCKWDPQVGDVDALSPFPLVMKASTWRHLASLAEQLAAESAVAEEEISQRPELLSHLGLPRALRRVLTEKAPVTPSAGRVIRFDFHQTTRGWLISEANSDVPGGFGEASHFTVLMAGHFPLLRPAGSPADVWSEALASAAGPSGVIALLSAPAYMEDHQVNAFLGQRLRERGCRTHLAKPEQIRWHDGAAYLDTTWYRGPLDVIVKFYQAEWLSRLPKKCGWNYFFRGGKTRVVNPALAVISESKRFPLVWDKLATTMPTWRTLLPETRDPRDVPGFRDDGWLLKTALCNSGDTVCLRESMKPAEWLQTRLAVRLSPGSWIAQRRFESIPVATPIGPRHACVGVYTVNGRAAGAYARLSTKSVINFEAVDVALLIEDDE